MAEMTGKQLRDAIQVKLVEARIYALQILSPVQVTALEASGMVIAPKWVVDTLQNVLTKAPTELPGDSPVKP